ncbi:PREDICTED: ras-related and estrogen-regulated growth inhibitor [Vollenhovia emeryi]|uniref:ras-related and estrogen-regulated growth inhibitor n=1 Tax=Vollenhovia emeryi TaxID=411798 RepID=UPI0005F364B4|nr:PREDICTED: ras-related and estrogen-regulated growth inhibitor [Vollenhovia emeryi]
MDSDGSLLASAKKRNSPPIIWGFSLARDSFKTVKVILLGQSGVGKSALAVRFATKRFIGEYDCTTDRIYRVDNHLGSSWEIADPPGYPPASAEPKLRWADAIILVYSVTDRVSFDETSHLRFLVSHARRGRKVPPVVLLVGNKADLSCSPGERMVSALEGQKRAKEIEAHAFHEISVRESVDQVTAIFMNILRLLTELHSSPGQQHASFRLRACTDGSIDTLRRPSPPPLRRRFSISARGNLL